MEKEKILQFTDDTIERLIIKKVYNDQAYAQLFSEIYDNRWVSDTYRNDLLKILIAFYKKTQKSPTKETLKALLSKHIQSKNSDLSIDDYISEFNNGLNSDIDTKNSDLVKECIFDYIHQKGVYFAIIDNLSEIEKRGDVKKTIKAFEKIINVNLDTDCGVNYFSDLQSHMDTLCSPAERLSTGYKELDYVTNGGLLKNGRCLMVPFGQPGIGKSLMLSNVAVNALMQNKTVVVFTLELSEHIYLQRVDAHITELEINSIPTNSSIALQKIKEFHKKYPQGNLIIKEYPPNSVSCANFDTFLNRLRARGIEPDIILIDYLKLVNPVNSFSGMNSYQKLDGVAVDLRALSSNWNCPVISPHQLNRSGANNSDLGMEHVAESYAINMTADIVLALFQGENDKEAGRMNSVILKNRLGGHVGKVLSWDIDYKTLRIGDLSESTLSEKTMNASLEELNLLGEDL